MTCCYHILSCRALHYQSIGGVWSKQIDFLWAREQRQPLLTSKLFNPPRAIQGAFVTMIKLLPFSGFSLLLDCLFSHLSSISRSVSLGYDSINKHCLKTHIPSRGCTVRRCRCFWTGMEHLLWLLESGAACARGAWGKAHIGSHINIETPQQVCWRSVMFSPG